MNTLKQNARNGGGVHYKCALNRLSSRKANCAILQIEKFCSTASGHSIGPETLPLTHPPKYNQRSLGPFPVVSSAVLYVPYIQCTLADH